MAEKWHGRSPTLSDVAQRAGVSRSLVSLAMRGEGGVSEETRKRIQKAAEDVSYRPNALARNLASGSSRSIGVVVGDILNPFHALLSQQVDIMARAQGYDVLFSINSVSDEAVRETVDVLRTHRVAGVVLIATPRDRSVTKAVAELLPSVYLGEHITDIEVDSVSTDDSEGAFLVVEHLVSRGHKRISHVDGGEEAGVDRRREGYILAMKQHGLKTDIVPGSHSVDAGDTGVGILLGNPPLPTAIFASNDLSAVGVISRLIRNDIKVPDDVAVVGYDDMPIAGTAVLSLTTVRQPVAAIARQALQALIRRIQKPNSPIQRVLIPPQLISRNSSRLNLPLEQVGRRAHRAPR
jgi:DNA-binding LacI/PurR family transcriptional regulator